MPSSGTFAAFAVVFKALSVAPAVYDKLRAATGKPGQADRRKLIVYCRRLNERRVFSAPYHCEVVESCIESLSQVAGFTDEAMAELDHPAAQAALGAILDDVRRFLDVWGGYRTPGAGRPMLPGFEYPPDDTEIVAFFQDLGALRERMGAFMKLVMLIEPKATAPKLLAGPGSVTSPGTPSAPHHRSG